MVTITSAQVHTTSGTLAAVIDRVDVGGGTQTVTVDGSPEERQHPRSAVFHVRLISPDRMLPDELREEADYGKACDLATRYAELLDEHATRLSSLANDLKV